MDTNIIIFGGRLGADPELLEVGETHKANLRLASTRVFKSKGESKEETTWMDVICWGKLAELVKEYCVKGQEVLVSGRLVVESWETEGQKKYATRIVADNINFGNKPRGTTGGNSVTPEQLKKYVVDAMKLVKKNVDVDTACAAVLEMD